MAENNRAVPGDDEAFSAALADLQTPQEVRISPCGQYVVYSLKAATRAGEYMISSIWKAKVGEENSAEQFTHGTINDRMPQWSPSGKNIAFVSDRAQRGKSSAIFVASPSSGIYYRLSPVGDKNIPSFKWSPDGARIAFLQSRNKTDPEDPFLYQGSLDSNCLWCVELATGKCDLVFGDAEHVSDFVWNETSDGVIFVTYHSSDINSPYEHGARFRQSQLNSHSTPMDLAWFNAEARNMALYDGHVYFLGPVPSNSMNAAITIWRFPIVGGAKPEICFPATDETVLELRSTSSIPAVMLQHGLKDRICLLNDLQKPLNTCIQGIGQWDLRFIHQLEIVLVHVFSSPNAPPELFYAQGNEFFKLTNHGEDMSKFSLPKGTEFYAEAEDGTMLDGVLLEPSTNSEKPWRTIIMPHGGPYYRIDLAFDHLGLYSWGPWLTAAGYAVLLPNYRGGSARGQKFADAARGGVGTIDYDDVIAMAKAGIKRGVIDKEYVAIGGWSQGGFLSYLAVTRPEFKFKAAICGAGVTDWDSLVMGSDYPIAEAELAGGAPWSSTADNVRARHGSAIWHMDKVKTPVLILHGEKDARIPLMQAVAFYRGAKHHGIECEMAVYPRESHFIYERAHFIDMMERIKRFLDRHMK